jgi:23S rRNA pseudoU1915 N3-methylase RlmH
MNLKSSIIGVGSDGDGAHGRHRHSVAHGAPDGLAVQRDRLEAGGGKWQNSFGAMTSPHQLVRTVLLKLIYRARSIQLGHRHHRL